MKRVFLDVDYTMILWKNDGRYEALPYGERYDLNEPLIDLMKRLRPQIKLIVWSFGGESYAKEWADRWLGRGLYDASYSKDPELITNLDIMIDDDINDWMKDWRGIKFLPHQIDEIEKEVLSES